MQDLTPIPTPAFQRWISNSDGADKGEALMASVIARAILCLIFGFFICETINEFNKLFGLSLNPYLAIVPAVLIFVFQEFVIKRWRANEKAVPINKPIKPKTDKVFYFIAWILVASFFLVILLV